MTHIDGVLFTVHCLLRNYVTPQYSSGTEYFQLID